jgi:polyvinyl alcohol dehydrogenase (cytochrome)
LRGSLSALDAATGAVVWKTYTVPPGFNGGAVWSSAAVDLANGTAFIGTGNAYTGTAAPTTDAIMKVDLASGAILGWFQGTKNDDFSSSTPGLDFDFGASPNLFRIGGRDVVGEGSKGGVYWVLDRATMKLLWHTQVGVGSVVGGILGSTAFDASMQRVIGPESLPGYVWSLAAATGLPNWVTAGLLDVVHLSPVAVSNGVVWSVATPGLLEAFLESTGTLIGEAVLNAIPPSGGYALGFGSGVSVAEGMVFADLGSQGTNGSVVAFTA